MTSPARSESPSVRASLFVVGKFGLVGVLNTAFDFALFSLLRLAAVPILTSNVVSTSVCMMLSFVMNRRFVFRATDDGWKRQATLFLLGTAFSMYVLQNGAIWFLVHVFPAPLDASVAVGRGIGLASRRWEVLLRSDTAKLVATGASLTWNFYFYRWAVFGDRANASSFQNAARRLWRAVPEALLPRALRWHYFVGAILALAAVWFHRYPAGIDLPQHANILRTLIDYTDGRSGYRYFYSLDFFTPYALAYLVGVPFAAVVSPLFAVKVLYTIAALGTPLALMRWLRAAGGEPAVGLLGFLLAFGYPYQWGFMSMVFATPLSFLYLAAFEELRNETTWKRVAVTSALGILLFFCHGIAFAVTMLASGVSFLVQRGIKRMVIQGVHYLPILAVLVPWYLMHRKQSNVPTAEPATAERIVRLFSALFSAQLDYRATMAGIAVAVVLFAAGRPVLSRKPSRVVPLVIALLGLFALPDTLFDTWQVGSRFAHFAQCFVPVALDFALDERALRRFRAVALAVVIVALGVLNYRLHVFNRELAGLDAVKQQMTPGADVELSTGNNKSETFGSSQHGQVAGWITAERGGILENSGGYFQLPARRREHDPWVGEFHYLVTRGSRSEAKKTFGKRGRLLASAGGFTVYEVTLPDMGVPGLELVRYAQSYKQPLRNLSVEGNPLSVGGKAFESGIGAHARSILQLRPSGAARALRGLVGMDDDASGATPSRFRVMNADRRTLWVSPFRRKGDAALPFEVSLAGFKGDLFLVTEVAGTSVSSAHTDWLELDLVR